MSYFLLVFSFLAVREFFSIILKYDSCSVSREMKGVQEGESSRKVFDLLENLRV